jgi:hypothetical protein
MAVNIRYEENVAAAAIINSPPVQISDDECEFHYGHSLGFLPNVGEIILIKDFVGVVVSTSSEVSGNFVCTVRYDPEVYELITTSGHTAKFYGVNTRLIGGSGTLTRNIALGKHSHDGIIYNKRVSFGFKCNTPRFYIENGMIDTLLRDDMFIQDNCTVREYAYFVSLNTEDLDTTSNKGRLELEFQIGTNKRYNI